MAGGRKSKYYTHVEPHLEQIKQWKIAGATDEQIATQLGIGKSSLYEYKNKYPELAEVLIEATQNFVLQVRGELAAMCLRRKLETVKKYIKKDVETGKKTEYTEVTTRELDPNLGAIELYLKNIDRDNFKHDWDNYEFKKQELELKKQIAEKDLW